MANNAQYSGITPEIYNTLKSQLSSLGISLQGNEGRISEKGVSAEYAYSPESQTLTINNVKVGFPASMMFNSDKIIQKISETVQGSGGQQMA